MNPYDAPNELDTDSATPLEDGKRARKRGTAEAVLVMFVMTGFVIAFLLAISAITWLIPIGS